MLPRELLQRGRPLPLNPRHIVWLPVGTWGAESPPGKASQDVTVLGQGPLLSLPTVVSPTGKTRVRWVIAEVYLSPMSMRL